MSLITALVGSKVAAVAVTLGTIAIGGTAAAACTGTLPAPLQQQVQALVVSPSPTASPDDTTDAGAAGTASSDETTASPEVTASPEATPTDTATPAVTTDTTTSTTLTATAVGPDATGPAGKGLCTAYLHGGLGATSIALRNLTSAAGGSDGIAAYCASVLLNARAKHHHSTTAATETSTEDTNTQTSTSTESDDQ
ncbi:MAG: hypothetical protein QOE37_1183, partial [Microbacteriaceae bacterium]|nr:hypothetical protein [Microbacteriaceae bacterium]